MHAQAAPVFDAIPAPDGGLAIVGNAPGIDAAAAIDAVPTVVRFNNAAGFGGGAGTRVTYLALVNRGGQMREWLGDPRFIDRPIVRRAEAFILPFPMLPPDRNGPERVCWTREALAMLAPLGRPIHILSEDLHDRACALLAAASPERPRPPGRPSPSTGFLVTLALLRDRPSHARPADAYGFAFSGWPGHPWAAERAWFAGIAAAGRLRLHASHG